MNAAVTVPHTLPAPSLEVIPSALVERIEATLADCVGITITDAPSLERANRSAVALHGLSKDIVARADAMKRPLNQLLAAVRDCVERAGAPVAEAKASITGKIAAWNREQARLEAERRAQEDAERQRVLAAAEAERKRLQAEADAAAKQVADDLEAVLGQPVEPVKVFVKVEPPALAPTVRTVAPAAPTAVVTRTVLELEIVDPKACAQAYEVGGKVVVNFERGTIKALIAAGVTVPGCRMVEREVTAMRGVR